MPYNGAYLVRMFPVEQFAAMMERDERPSISSAVVFVTREDHVAHGGTPCGVLYLRPDWASAYAQPNGTARRVEVMASWVDQQGLPVSECARSTLDRLARRIQHEHRLTVLLGFEVEVVFQFAAKDVDMASTGSARHGWSTMVSVDHALLPMVEAVVRALEKASVPVAQFHAESASGQWEFVLQPGPPVAAVDSLVRAREITAVVAQAHGARSTLHPRPVTADGGTGAHVHISVTPWSSSSPTDAFFAGILHHIRAVAAFALPLDVSYERVRSGIWSGGEYVCWGWQNREAPLRRITTTRFEIKMLCGTANPYLALATLLSAGLDGLNSRLPLTAGDCQHDPASRHRREPGGP